MWDALEAHQTRVARFVETYQGKLNTPEDIVACLDEMEQLLITGPRIWSYAELVLEADYTDNALW